ncbi:hypothetical protein HG535_0F01130 [Zygotorulaspora mrakii]|uniref:rRNA adenine N(6)-methyltransferase n=1 Tax=Zygotorulaspora mrakii TaxID=42260 RepID=A0A7H9B559_ZYGMR|nr:uncharacterized protein HG535_0F01130 [Zygotorulaspora mrakii]QLG73603.1 hypothetical protein HG535_0F01130 [Zygotorulaspora mrakii]
MSLPVKNLQILAQIKHYYGFRYLLNPVIHNKILDKLNLQKTYGNFQDTKILDLYPGPAQHAAIFYNRFRPEQYTLMENRTDFFDYLKTEYSNSELQLAEKNPYEWSSYTDLIDNEKQFVPDKQPLTQINNRFLVTANLTNASHEGLVMQWFTCIGNRNWLQRFGRVKMLVWVPTPVAAKLLASPGSNARSKCSVVRETFTETHLIALSNTKECEMFHETEFEQMSPIVFPNTDVWQVRDKGIALLEINPTAHQVDLDNWDYVTKHLLILKKTPLKESLDSLGHGGKDYFNLKITDKNLLEKSPGQLTSVEFIYLSKLFDEWPFKPDIYMDFVDVYQEEGLH